MMIIKASDVVVTIGGSSFLPGDVPGPIEVTGFSESISISVDPGFNDQLLAFLGKRAPVRKRRKRLAKKIAKRGGYASPLAPGFRMWDRWPA